jgi:hypothetical protein
MYLIPAIEWDEKIITGDTTTASAVITNVPDTSEIVTGQVIYGDDIPYNSRVVSKTASTVTLDQNATDNNTGISISAYTRFDFEYPAQEDNGESISSNQSTTLSLTGVSQTILNYVDADRVLKFSFITKADKDILVDSFFIGWAIYGKTFRYFDDKEVNSVKNYFLESKNISPKRVVKKHPDFLYELDFTFRRVIV